MFEIIELMIIKKITFCVKISLTYLKYLLIDNNLKPLYFFILKILFNKYIHVIKIYKRTILK